MKTRSPALATAIAAAVGMLLWFGTCFATGKREAWDSGLYWGIAYPLALLVSAFLGYRHPHRPWRWPLLLFEAQCLAMLIRGGEMGSLWPLGVVLFAILALPGILVARLAARRAP